MGIQPEVFQRFPEVHHIAGACVQAFPQTTHRSSRWRSRCTDEHTHGPGGPGLSLSARGARRPHGSTGFAVPWRQPAKAGLLLPPPRFRELCLWPPLETTGLGFWLQTMAGSLRPLVLLPPPCPVPVWPATASLTSALSMECCHGSMPFPPAFSMRRCSSWWFSALGRIFSRQPMEYWQGRCPLTPNRQTHLGTTKNRTSFPRGVPFTMSKPALGRFFMGQQTLPRGKGDFSWCP